MRNKKIKKIKFEEKVIQEQSKDPINQKIKFI